ncbi:hypothetical protein ACEPPN_006283 [Leptodophora sp. 'Broadleaf-Isolate-01']
MTGFYEVTLVLGHLDVPMWSGYVAELLKTGPVTDSLRYFDNIGYRDVSEGMFEHVIVNDEKTNVTMVCSKSFRSYRSTEPRTCILRIRLFMDGYNTSVEEPTTLIVLSNGKKVNPIPMENKIGSHPLLRSALVIRYYRFNATLLVELEDARIPRTVEERHELLDKIWPTIQEANEVAPRFARTPKSLVTFATAEKPFLRAGKGTV